MIFKAGVSFIGIKPPLVLGLLAADAVHRQLYGDDVVVTSLVDGEHRKDSLHYKGLAADLRTHDHPNPEKFRALLAAQLGDEFDVILEDAGHPNEHIHLEHDPKGKP